MATTFFTKAIIIVVITYFACAEAFNNCVDNTVAIDCSKRTQYCQSEEWTNVMIRFCPATCGFCTNSTTEATVATPKATSIRPTVPVASTSLVQQTAASTNTSSWLPSWFSSIGSPKTAVLASQDAAGTKNFGYFSF